MPSKSGALEPPVLAAGRCEVSPLQCPCHGSELLPFCRDTEAGAGSIMQLFGPQMPFISPFLLLQHLSNNTGPTEVLCVSEASPVHRLSLCPRNLSRFTLVLFTAISQVGLENTRSGQG